MNNEFGITLIAVVNSVKIVLYEAKGIKIIKKLKGFPKIVEKQTRNQLKKSESHYAKKFSPESLFEPHSLPKDLEYKEAAKNIVNVLEQEIASNSLYQHLIIVANPKMLAYIRKFLDKNLKALLDREIVKDIVDEDMKFIEHTVFG